MAKFLKNESIASKRRMHIYVFDNSGNPAPLATDFTGAGACQIDNGSGWVNRSGSIANNGVDGDWVYTATQAELNVDASEFAVKLHLGGFKDAIQTAAIFDVADFQANLATAANLATVLTDLAVMQGDVTTILSDLGTLLSSSASILTNTDNCVKAAYGRWKIIGTQLLLYDIDNTTVIKTYNLKDAAGNPTNTSIFERMPT